MPSRGRRMGTAVPSIPVGSSSPTWRRATYESSNPAPWKHTALRNGDGDRRAWDAGWHSELRDGAAAIRGQLLSKYRHDDLCRIRVTAGSDLLRSQLHQLEHLFEPTEYLQPDPDGDFQQPFLDSSRPGGYQPDFAVAFIQPRAVHRRRWR